MDEDRETEQRALRGSEEPEDDNQAVDPKLVDETNRHDTEDEEDDDDNDAEEEDDEEEEEDEIRMGSVMWFILEICLICLQRPRKKRRKRLNPFIEEEAEVDDDEDEEGYEEYDEQPGWIQFDDYGLTVHRRRG